MTTPVWIGLGSNLGDRKAILDAAVDALAGAPGVAVKAVSSYHETSPVGGPPGQGAFLNAAARLETTLDPHRLLAVTQEIEDRAGRVRTARWGERTLDLDILIYGARFLDTEELSLPHPRLAFRRFVLAPLAEIAPSVVDASTMRTITDLLANLDRRPRLLLLEGPPGPRKSKVFRRLVDELPGVGIEWGELCPEPDRSENPPLGLADPAQAPWFVADVLLEAELIRPGQSPARAGADRETARAGRPEFTREMGRIRASARRAMEPTLAAVLTEGPGMRRRPGIDGTPLLWLDSTDPDAIADEVLATCRSIEGV